MTIYIQIDRLVLDGVPLSHRERESLAPAIQRELAQLTSAGDAAEAGDRPPSRVDGIARDVAAAVHRELGPAARTRSWQR